MKKVIIPGGSGFLGQYTARFLKAKGYEPILLSRSAAQQGGIRSVAWDGQTLGDWVQELEGAEAVLNLAGRTVNCRYTAENKRQILDSRLDSTRILGQAIAQCQQPPKVWLNSSSATIYSDTRGDMPANDELSARIGDDFSMGVCKAWEQVFQEAATPQTRKIALRATIVLGKGGGAIEPLLGLVKYYLGGTQGGGDQYFSWLHVEDFARMILFLIEREDLSGVFNCAAPNPITNRELMQTLRRAYGRSWGLPMPAWMLRMGAVFIKTEAELVLKSRKVVSKRFADAGFQFQYPTLDKAVQEIVNG